MQLRGYGLLLTRVRHSDIELIRQHRNSQAIRQYMEYREEITPEQQENWFHSINNRYNNYFIIHFRDQPVGLIYGSQIDWEKKETGNGGIFIWAQEWMETPVPLASSLLLTETSFLLGQERTYIKVLHDNLRAVAFNRNLGYQLLPGQENVANQRYVLTKENYYKKADRFRHSFLRMYGDVFTVTLDQPGDDSEAFIAALYPSLPEADKQRLRLVVA